MPLPTEQKDPEDKGRTMNEVSKDIGEAHEQPKMPDPKPKTKEELLEDPEEAIKDKSVTGD